MIDAALKQAYALQYVALSRWNAPTPKLQATQKKMLALGKMIGTGAVTLAGAQQYLVPYVKELAGVEGPGVASISAVMQLWIKAAQRVMTMQATPGLSGLSGLGTLDSILDFGPFILIGAGAVLIFMGMKHEQ